MHRIAALTIAALLPATLVAQQRLEYEDYHLENGLHVILVEDHSVPIVTVDIWYNVGSANERPGRSGFAHLFEHMMFQGSANVGKAEHIQLVQRAGGTVNGTTNEDRTDYFQTLPANRLNLGLWLEADRMRSLAVTQENLDNQRNAVQEERRLRVDNQPYAPAFLESSTMLYDSTDCFAYAHTVIGSMEDLDAADLTDVQDFFAQYYSPANATLTLVGDFDPDNTRDLIQQYFGDIPSREQPAAAMCEWSVGTQPMTMVWEDALANLPAVIIAYRTPGHASREARALQMLNLILGSGETSRLNRRMVRDERTAAVAATQYASNRHGSPLAAVAIANQGIDPVILVTQIQESIADVRENGITEDELERAKNSFRSSNILGLQTTHAVAQRVQHYVHYHESLDEMHTDLDEYMSITTDDVLRAAQTYLIPENSLTITVVTKGTTDAPVPDTL
jgi:predicted Zn-dependent peptidase